MYKAVEIEFLLKLHHLEQIKIVTAKVGGYMYKDTK